MAEPTTPQPGPVEEYERRLAAAREEAGQLRITRPPDEAPALKAGNGVSLAGNMISANGRDRGDGDDALSSARVVIAINLEGYRGTCGALGPFREL